jgi:DNA polymerase III epsilon subunit-like protein
VDGLIHIGTPIAIVDVESSGLHPSSDRIVELAVVQMDFERFPSLDGPHWNTLVNPGTDVGPTFAHGITNEDVQSAPRFADVQPELAHLLRDRIIASHNVNFDAAFLRYEHWRMDLEFPHYPLLDTGRMAMALGLVPAGGSRSLEALCARENVLRVQDGDEHTALGDAVVTARLLRRYLGYALEAGMTFRELGLNQMAMPEFGRLPKRSGSLVMPRK